MFFGYFLKYFSRTIKILEKSKDLQIDHPAYFLMYMTIFTYTLDTVYQ